MLNISIASAKTTRTESQITKDTDGPTQLNYLFRPGLSYLMHILRSYATTV